MSNMYIRAASPADGAELLAIYAPYVKNTAITFDYDVPLLDEFVLRMEAILKKYPYIVAVSDGEIVGYAYADTFKDRAAYDWSVETTVYVKSGHKRAGVGRALYTALEERLRAHGILNMYACIAIPDSEDEYLPRDSQLFHRQMGFQTVGEFHKCGFKFGRWYNMIWMEKLIGTHTSEQKLSGKSCKAPV